MTAVSFTKTNTQAGQDMLGGMSRGLAHDLQDLLTPVSTYLQLCAEGAAGRAKVETLLPVARRNLKTAQAYIQQARHFSEHAQPLMRSDRSEETRDRRHCVCVDVPDQAVDRIFREGRISVFVEGVDERIPLGKTAGGQLAGAGQTMLSPCETLLNESEWP